MSKTAGEDSLRAIASWTEGKTGDLSSLTTTNKSNLVAATNEVKGDLEGRIKQNAGAPTTATVGTVGQLLVDTTNAKLYQCTAVTPGVDPDPTTYTWTEVGSGGGVTELTDADCDWDGSTSPTVKGICTGLLDAGVYHVTNTSNSSMRLYGAVATGGYPSSSDSQCSDLSAGLDTYFVVYSPQFDKRTQTFVLGSFASDFKIFSQYFTDNTKTAPAGGSGHRLLNDSNIVSNLTSTSTDKPLAASQGKALNDKIGDLSTLTTTAKTSAVAAINELDSEIPVLTMTSTDPGEGVALAANHFVAYYE